MHDERTSAPDSTAVRVALWRAMHVQVDPPPHVLEDEIGLRLEFRQKKRPPEGGQFPSSSTRFSGLFRY